MILTDNRELSDKLDVMSPQVTSDTPNNYVQRLQYVVCDVISAATDYIFCFLYFVLTMGSFNCIESFVRSLWKPRVNRREFMRDFQRMSVDFMQFQRDFLPIL